MIATHHQHPRSTTDQQNTTPTSKDPFSVFGQPKVVLPPISFIEQTKNQNYSKNTEPQSISKPTMPSSPINPIQQTKREIPNRSNKMAPLSCNRIRNRTDHLIPNEIESSNRSNSNHFPLKTQILFY